MKSSILLSPVSPRLSARSQRHPSHAVGIGTVKVLTHVITVDRVDLLCSPPGPGGGAKERCHICQKLDLPPNKH